MPKLNVLPGEREEAFVRPTPWSYVPAWLRTACFALWGAILWAVFREPWWADHEAGSVWQFWTYLYGNPAMGHVLNVAGLVGGGMALFWALRRTWWHGGVLGGIIGLTVAAVTTVWFPASYTIAIPVLLFVVSIVGLVILEIDRWGRAITFTNVRLIAHGGLLDRTERAIRYEDIADIDMSQGIFGRIFDFGDLVPVLAEHAKEDEGVYIPAIRPLKRGRELLAAMVQHATASAEMKIAGDTESHLYRALKHFRRPPGAGPVAEPPRK